MAEPQPSKLVMRVRSPSPALRPAAARPGPTACKHAPLRVARAIDVTGPRHDVDPTKRVGKPGRGSQEFHRKSEGIPGPDQQQCGRHCPRGPTRRPGRAGHPWAWIPSTNRFEVNVVESCSHPAHDSPFGEPLVRVMRAVRLHKWRTLGAVVVLAAGVGVGIFLTTSSSGADYQLTSAATGTVQQSVSATSTLEAANQADLDFQTAGKVATVNVTVGQQVVAGAVLGTLDPSSLQATEAMDEASVATDESKLSSDESGQTVQSANQAITTAQQQVVLQNQQIVSDQTAITNDQTNLTSTEASNAVSLAQSQNALSDAQTKLTTDESTLSTDESAV